MNTVNPANSFANHVIELLGRIEYRLAETKEDKQAIYRLRYECYLREGAIRPNKRGIFKDSYDSSPNVWIFGMYLGDKLVSSIRIHAATKACPISPGMAVFGDVLGARIEAGETVIDPTRLVVDHEQSRANPGLAYATVRLGFMASEFFRADLGLATVRTEHRAFYKRLFFMEAMGEPRHYPGLKKPINLMGIHYPSVHQRIVSRYPFMASSAIERDFLFGRGQPAHAVPARIEPSRRAKLPVRGQAAAA
ncbi:MAG: hypothetical protein J0H01_03460 [Rhizobiales bacterium]|nr:hypothetical protein [Hyphomicrobiales bacterium]